MNTILNKTSSQNTLCNSFFEETELRIYIKNEKLKN